MCLAAKSLISTQKKKSSEIICEKALEIIENKYADQELSLLSVSGEIGVSPNYLSTLIKKNTGRTFVELLTDRRIRKARELLLGTTMKIREITEACGYRDQFYFSHCFKKITGMSPKNAGEQMNRSRSRRNWKKISISEMFVALSHGHGAGERSLRHTDLCADLPGRHGAERGHKQRAVGRAGAEHARKLYQ